MGSKVPYPDRRYLGGWWNVWDHNDFVSYTGKAIFDGLDDEPSAGAHVEGVHGERGAGFMAAVSHAVVWRAGRGMCHTAPRRPVVCAGGHRGG
ncbi:MAG TPA: hypothetical protein VIV12_01405 [Streptosporangiaceae bacterium]